MCHGWSAELSVNCSQSQVAEIQSVHDIDQKYFMLISNLSNSWFKFVISSPEDEDKPDNSRECSILPENTTDGEGVSRDTLEAKR